MTKTGSIKTARPIDLLLTWAFQREAAGRGGGGGASWGLYWSPESRDGVLACARNGYGLRVDGSGLAKAASTRGHPDAEALYQAAWASAAPELVIEYARQGGTPDWMPGAQPRLVPKRYEANGDPMTLRMTVAGRRLGPLYCPVKIADSEDLIDWRRGIYERWWKALDGLARDYREGVLAPLRDWLPLPPRAPQKPWEGNEDALSPTKGLTGANRLT